MIRVRRPNRGPAVLTRMGEKQTQLDCAAYEASPADYKSGQSSFPKRTYYNLREVKDLLMKVHHNKCCYCETKLWSRAYLHVEHFRPKSGVRRTLDQKKDDRPGYYWLAYCWKNLLPSCINCNRPSSLGSGARLIGKGNLFPVSGKHARCPGEETQAVSFGERWDHLSAHFHFTDPTGNELAVWSEPQVA